MTWSSIEHELRLAWDKSIDLHYDNVRRGRFLIIGCTNVFDFAKRRFDPYTDTCVFHPFIYHENMGLQADVDMFLCLADCLQPITNQEA